MGLSTTTTADGKGESWVTLAYELMTHPAAGYVLFAISTAITFIIYFRQKQDKRPCYSLRSLNIVRDLASHFKSVEIKHGSENVPTLTVTKLVFWNNGRETLNRGDVAENDPLRITVRPGQQILEATIIFVKRAANAFEIIAPTDLSERHITFDFADFRDGIIISILHTGTSSADVEMLGTLKGAKALDRRSHRTKGLLARVTKLTRGGTGRIRGRIMATACFVAPFLFAPVMVMTSGTSLLNHWFSISMSGIATAAYWYLGYAIVRQTPPRGFDIFDDDFDSLRPKPK